MERLSIDLHGQTVQLELEWISSELTAAPLIIFLHEGLGSVHMWEDWPSRLCKATGCRGLVYSRYGYGRSSPRPSDQTWPVDYLEDEARAGLPALMKALNIDVVRDRPILFGHSDGGSIALLYAAAFPESLAGIIVVAPHVFAEEIGLTRIKYLQQAYTTGPLRDKLAGFHTDPDAVFWGWSNRWLAPDFRAWNITFLLAGISCPTLAVQGAQDQYGGMGHLYEIQRHVPECELVVLEDCRHVPHQEQPEALVKTVGRFLTGLRRTKDR